MFKMLSFFKEGLEMFKMFKMFSAHNARTRFAEERCEEDGAREAAQRLPLR